MLTLQQKGKLLDAIFEYSEKNKETKLEPVVKMAFNFIKEDIDINQEKYEARVKRNRENGQKGGRPRKKKETQRNPKNPKKPTGLSGINMNPKKPDNDSDSDSDNNTTLKSRDESKPKKKNFGDPVINELTKYLKDAIGMPLDGSQKMNRYTCNHLINKYKKQFPDHDEERVVKGIKMLIDMGLEDEFHGKNITSFKYLHRNFAKIINAISQKTKQRTVKRF